MHLLTSGQWDLGAMSGQPGPNPVGLLEESPPKDILCWKIAPLCPAVINWNQQSWAI